MSFFSIDIAQGQVSSHVGRTARRSVGNDGVMCGVASNVPTAGPPTGRSFGLMQMLACGWAKESETGGCPL